MGKHSKRMLNGYKRIVDGDLTTQLCAEFSRSPFDLSALNDSRHARSYCDQEGDIGIATYIMKDSDKILFEQRQAIKSIVNGMGSANKSIQNVSWTLDTGVQRRSTSNWVRKNERFTEEMNIEIVQENGNPS